MFRSPSRPIRRALLIAGLAALAACEAPPPLPTAAEQRNAAIGDAVRAASQAGRACAEALRARPDFAAIYEKLPVGRGGVPLARLNDATRPTAAEAVALMRWQEANLPCRRHYLDAADARSPDHGAALRTHHARTDALYLALAQRSLSWGEALRQMEELRSRTEAANAEADRRLAASLEAQHQAELDRREAEAARREAASREIWREYSERVRRDQEARDREAAEWNLRNELNRPRHTDCQQIGANIRCVTQ